MMKKNNKIYQQINKVCSLFFCIISAWIGLMGCSPKEAEILWSADSEQVQMASNASETDMNAEAVLEDEEQETAPSEVRQSIIYVHVCGAVMDAGVVELPEGSRVRDALDAAGGFAEDASREYVNLAAQVIDGQQLFFPTMEEVESMEQMGMSQSALDASGNTLNSTIGKVNINTADESRLCTLPGIGVSKAQAIIAYREKHGPFATPEDIMKVTGIKTSAYEKIQDKIVVQ